jgi:hypothetical protein
MVTINQLPETALVLVAVMPSPKDMEIARLLGWYRIPLRLAPKLIDVDYILFYQTGKFAEGHQSVIETFAEVKGHELTTRSELIRDEPDHPRANEEYFKVELGPLCSLQTPINTEKWKRVSFFYTLGNLVNQAKIINDLVVRTDDREVLWNTIREKNLAVYAGKKETTPTIPDEDIFKLLEQVIFLNSGLRLNEFDNHGQEFNQE